MSSTLMNDFLKLQLNIIEIGLAAFLVFWMSTAQLKAWLMSSSESSNDHNDAWTGPEIMPRLNHNKNCEEHDCEKHLYSFEK